MTVKGNFIKGISIVRVGVHVNRSQDRWTKPNQWIVSVIRTDKGAIASIRDRLWRKVPLPLLDKVLEIERRLKNLFYTKDICVFKDRSMKEEDEYAEITVDRNEYTASIYVEQVNEMLKAAKLPDDKISAILEILSGRSGVGRSKADAKTALASKIEESFAEWAIRFLDSAINGPKYLIEKDLK